MTVFSKEKINELKKADIENHFHPTTNIAELIEKGPKIIVEGKGCRVTDIDGKSYIDGGAGLWLNNVGYGRNEIVEAAKEQMEKLHYIHGFNGFSNVPAIELATKLASMVPVEDAKIFFTNDGSESNDTAYKIARLHFYHKGQPQKNQIIGRRLAYHGLNFGGLSATNLPNFAVGFGPLLPGFHHIEPPYCYKCPWGKELSNCSLECANALEEKISELGKENVAAFSAEPISGAGGVIMPPPGYYEKIREICDKNDVLYISDEVISAFGRTGKMFGIEHWDAKPDIMMMAKGITCGYMPLGAVAVSDKVYDPIREYGAVWHGYTYSTHPVACAAALKNIEIIERENLAERASEQGEKLQSGLQKLGLPAIGEVRGKGLMIGIDFVKDAATKEKFDPGVGFVKKLSDVAYENGLILRPLPGDIMQISPALIISDEEIDEYVGIVKKSVEQAYQECIK